MSKKSIVAEATKGLAEIDIARKQKELKEGLEAEKTIAKIQTQEEKKLREIGDKYLDGDIYERERVVGEAIMLRNQTVQSMIGLGRRLLAIKEAEKHGEWLQIFDARIGLSQPTAWRFMAIARKFSNYSRVKDFTVLDIKHGVGKFYALLNVPDDELAEFDETGLFRGATTEDINKMSVSQFRKLVAEKEDWKAKARQFELEVQSKYDTTKQYKEKLSKKDGEIKALKERIESQGIPEDEQEALGKIANLKVQLRGLIRIIEGANLDAYSDEIKAELQLLAQYAHDRGELCLGRVLERLGGVSYAPFREQAEADFLKKHAEDED